MIIFAAALTGYIAFATFLVNQAIYLSVVGSALAIADIIAQDGTEAILKPDAPVGARLLAMAGLRRNALAQIVVILQGVARLVVLVVAFAAVLKPWGVQSQDMFGALRSAYFGFSIGGVTLSLSSMIGAAIVFAVAVFFTRLIQNWLGSRLLPQTRLDAGVRNSVRTIFGYVGVIVAALLAGAQIGLDVQKLALIAGGLSVGIGFGLQTIANNFVSGLILLWERTIRVGDWVVVGREQGFVRAINARATEIETFDRGSLIVPNSNLVSGVVKNWVHNDRVGRIIVSVNVAYESDLDRGARPHDRRGQGAGPGAGDSCAHGAVRRVRRLGAQVQPDLLRRRHRARASGREATSISTSCAECGRRACASPIRRPAGRALRFEPKPGAEDLSRAASRRRRPPRLPADDRLLAREPPMVAGERA